MPSLNSQMAKGAIWMLSLKLITRLISIISMIILARILLPADFGLVAMATSIIGLLELATAFSFDVPLIQNQSATKEHYSSAWTLNISLYSLLAVLLVIIAKPASAYFGEPRLVAVIYVLSFGFLLSGYENIWFVEFRKEMNFHQDFILMLAKKLSGFVTTVPLALIYNSYWALVAGMLTSKIVGVGLSYVLHPGRPRLCFSKAREMLSFSKWLLANNSLAFLRTRSPDFIIGRLSGASSLGLFSVAYEIATLPTTELVAPLNRAVFPGYSKLSKDLLSFKASYLGTVGIIALVALPAGIGLSAISGPLVLLVLGEKWVLASPLIASLAAASAISCLTANNSSVYYALGRPYLITILGTVYVAWLLSCSIYMGLRGGVSGVAGAYLIVAASFSPLSFWVLSKQLSISLLEILRVLWRPVSASILMYFSVAALTSSMDKAGIVNHQIVIGGVLLGGSLYILITLLLWLMSGKPDGPETWLTRLLRQKLVKGLTRL